MVKLITKTLLWEERRVPPRLREYNLPCVQLLLSTHRGRTWGVILSQTGGTNQADQFLWDQSYKILWLVNIKMTHWDDTMVASTKLLSFMDKTECFQRG